MTQKSRTLSRSVPLASVLGWVPESASVREPAQAQVSEWAWESGWARVPESVRALAQAPVRVPEWAQVPELGLAQVQELVLVRVQESASGPERAQGWELVAQARESVWVRESVQARVSELGLVQARASVRESAQAPVRVPE